MAQICSKHLYVDRVVLQTVPTNKSKEKQVKTTKNLVIARSAPTTILL